MSGKGAEEMAAITSAGDAQVDSFYQTKGEAELVSQTSLQERHQLNFMASKKSRSQSLNSWWKLKNRLHPAELNNKGGT